MVDGLLSRYTSVMLDALIRSIFQPDIIVGILRELTRSSCSDGEKLYDSALQSKSIGSSISQGRRSHSMQAFPPSIAATRGCTWGSGYVLSHLPGLPWSRTAIVGLADEQWRDCMQRHKEFASLEEQQYKGFARR